MFLYLSIYQSIKAWISQNNNINTNNKQKKEATTRAKYTEKKQRQKN